MALRVLYLGTYQCDRSRNRTLIAALRAAGAQVEECNVDVWRGVADKVQIGGFARLRYLCRWIAAYPKLMRLYLATPRHDVVVIGYMGHFDVLVLSWLVRLRRVPLVWDAFLSLYDTVVCDRRLLPVRHPLARLLKSLERSACRSADRVILDTAAHATLFTQLYHLPARRTGVVLLGTDQSRFPRLPPRGPTPANPIRVLFYGHFIPLHGTGTIAEAVRLARGLPIQWTFIGEGQDAPATRRTLDREPAARVHWLNRVPYHELVEHIAKADVCLGIFGNTAKASRVIPHKVYEVLSAGRPLVTRDSPAIRELVSPCMRGIRLVPAADPAALVAAVLELASAGEIPPTDLGQKFAQPALGRQMLSILQDAITEKNRR